MPCNEGKIPFKVVYDIVISKFQEELSFFLVSGYERDYIVFSLIGLVHFLINFIFNKKP